MALSMADKLRQAAASRMAQTAGATTARLDYMDARATTTSGVLPVPPVAHGTGRQTEQINQTDKLNREIKQIKPAVGPNRENQQLCPTAQQLDTTVEPNISAVESNRQFQCSNSTDKSSRQIKRTNKANKSNGQNQQLDTTDETENKTGPCFKLQPRRPLVTAAQKTLAAYFLANGEIVATLAVIARESGIPLGTVRCVIDKFSAHGWLQKSQWGSGSNRALKLLPTKALAVVCPRDVTVESIGQIQQTSQTQKPSRQFQPLNQTVKSNSENGFLKIDRKNLSICLETLTTSWPTLARAGFGLEQIEQIHATLAQLGKAPDRIVQGLDHAEWELAEGKMTDKAGQSVADPCAWVFRSLASQGYYRRPAGYVSPEEQAERDAVEEAKALARTRENARQERFRAWLQGLSVEERKNALTGRIGPEEAWLKKEWAKRGEPT